MLLVEQLLPPYFKISVPLLADAAAGYVASILPSLVKLIDKLLNVPPVLKLLLEQVSQFSEYVPICWLVAPPQSSAVLVTLNVMSEQTHARASCVTVNELVQVSVPPLPYLNVTVAVLALQVVLALTWA
jgi:hypothetical protein